MSVCLLTITDRPEYLAQTLRSARENLPVFDHYVTVADNDHRLGFAGAIREGWRRVLLTGADYCFHLEDDFVFEAPAPVERMLALLDRCPHLVQVALLRQPVNEREKAAGGIVAMDPDLYEREEWRGERFLTHRRNVTTNPSLWPRWVLERGWPDCEQSEGVFGIDLFASDPRLRAAYWGWGEEWCEHIGKVRAGVGY